MPRWWCVREALPARHREPAGVFGEEAGVSPGIARFLAQRPTEGVVVVETMRDRGVEDARLADMFSLQETFDRDRFGAALAHGTQLGLVRSMDGLRSFLGDLAHVTRHDATAVVDSYDPGHEATSELLGYRDDPTPGLAFRVMAFEYDGETGETLLFRLFSPDRVREATTGTGWTVVDVERDDPDSAHYRIALEKTAAIDG